ncbi:MAG: ComF family protein [Alphaproteobacteria bacterium]|nr:ComF family protein [Alphaproteobacteria bacterium]
MKKILSYLFNIVFPPRCLYCGKIISSPNSICEECFEKISFISAPYCQICGIPFEVEKQTPKNLICPSCAAHKRLTRLNRSAIVYDDFSKNGILSFKFHDKLAFSKLFTKWLKLSGKDIFEQGVDLIIPVPLSYRRLLRRRYNQAAILAKELSELTGIKTDLMILKRIKHTKAQSLLSHHVRLKNVRNAFEVSKPQNIKGKRILLIDDVMTTGATLCECAKVLIKAGAESVDTLTVARTLRE